MREHLSDQELMESLEAEPAGDVLEHLVGCPRCRSERQRFEAAVTGLAKQAHASPDRPEAAWDRQARQILARLRAPARRVVPWRWTWAPVLVGLAVVAGLWLHGPSPRVVSPVETDEALLAAVDRRIQADIPTALQPAALLLGAVETGEPGSRDSRQGG